MTIYRSHFRCGFFAIWIISYLWLPLNLHGQQKVTPDPGPPHLTECRTPGYNCLQQESFGPQLGDLRDLENILISLTSRIDEKIQSFGQGAVRAELARASGRANQICTREFILEYPGTAERCSLVRRQLSKAGVEISEYVQSHQ